MSPLLLVLPLQFLMNSCSLVSVYALQILLLWGLCEAFSSPGWTAQALSACLCRGGTWVLLSSSCPALDLLQQLRVLLMLWAPAMSPALRRAEWRRRIPSPGPLATLHLMQPRIFLAFWAASSHCWLTVSFSSAITPKSFSSVLLSVTFLHRL